MTMPMRPLPEKQWIAQLRRQTADGMDDGAGRRFLRIGIGDDCAVLRPKAGEELLVTTDFSIEGIHFRREWHPAESVGHRCLARGLSDIAAMGGVPRVFFLSLALPSDLPQRWADGFMRGMLRLAKEAGVQLAGGDTSSSGGGRNASGSAASVVADVMVLGTVKQGRAVLRSGARAGDRIYVTGALGGSAAVLARLMAGETVRARSAANRAHFFPEPRLGAGMAIARLATAMVDVSDGLSTDLAHLCEESGLGAKVQAERLPVARGSSIDEALHGGEDYELLFTASAGKRVPAVMGGAKVHCIGEMVAGHGTAMWIERDGSQERLRAQGWEHFRG